MLIGKLPDTCADRKKHYNLELMGSHIKNQVRYELPELIALFAIDLHAPSTKYSTSAASARAGPVVTTNCHNCGEAGHLGASPARSSARAA